MTTIRVRNVFLAFLGMCLGALVPAGTAAAATVGSGGTICVRGTLTAEGAECQALRGDDGKLYTIAGRKTAGTANTKVCVCGKIAAVSTCMQGTTIAGAKISKPDDCPK